MKQRNSDIEPQAAQDGDPRERRHPEEGAFIAQFPAWGELSGCCAGEVPGGACPLSQETEWKPTEPRATKRELPRQKALETASLLPPLRTDQARAMLLPKASASRAGYTARHLANVWFGYPWASGHLSSGLFAGPVGLSGHHSGQQRGASGSLENGGIAWGEGRGAQRRWGPALGHLH